MFESKDWYKKTISLAEGIDQAEDVKRKRDDILTEFKNMEVAQSSDGSLCMKYKDGRTFTPTPYAWKKILHWHNMPTNFMELVSADIINPRHPELNLTRDSLDYSIARSWIHRHRKTVDPEKKFLFRTYNDGTMRTMVSDRYGVIDNGWYLETLQNLFKELGGDEPRLFNWRGNEDTIYGNLLLMDTIITKDDGEYGAMLSMSNCEIGRRVFSQRPSIFRGICSNGCIFGQQHGEIVKRKHLGDIDYQLLAKKLVSNIQTQIPIAQEGIDSFLALTDKKFECSEKALFAVLVDKFKFNKGTKSRIHSVIDAYVEHEKPGLGNKNLFGIVNAFTRAGQQFEDEDWVKYDEIGGYLMNMNDGMWNSLQNRAKNMSKVELDEVFGVAV